MPNQKLDGKTALITGGSRGIGRAIAIAFAKEGADICITYNSQKEKAAEVCDEIQSLGQRCISLKVDVTDRNSIRSVLSTVIKKWKTLDILVNNAGYLRQKPFFTISDSDWNRGIVVNLTGVFICTQEAAKIFKKKKGGCVINISSVGGQIGGPKAAHYSAAKAGVISFTKSTARILAPYGIRVNAISPGFIRATPMYEDIIKRSSEKAISSDILLGRPGEPEEVASAAVFLASNDSSYITGHVLNVNGGLFLG